jgi:hypothetical protein
LPPSDQIQNFLDRAIRTSRIITQVRHYRQGKAVLLPWFQALAQWYRTRDLPLFT